MAKAIFQGILGWLASAYLRPSLQLLELKAATYYLEGIKSTHRILVGVCLIVLAVSIIGAGMVLIPLAMILFMPWQPATKALVVIIIGVAYVLVSGLALAILLSEKRLMRLTGASGVLQRLTG